MTSQEVEKLADKELKKLTKEVEKEDNIKNPLIDFFNNRTDIRTISENTFDYIKEIKPDLRLGTWQLIPKVCLVFMKNLKKFVASNEGDFYITVGNIFKIGVEATKFKPTEKGGTINPAMIPLDGFNYKIYTTSDSDPLNLDILSLVNALSEKSENIPEFISDKPESLKEVALTTLAELKNSYGVNLVGKWLIVIFIFFAFMKVSKEYIIKRKDDFENGLSIEFSRVFNYGIDVRQPDDEDVEIKDEDKYSLFFSTNQDLRLAVKSDDKTETDI